jgi:hypothetical protein
MSHGAPDYSNVLKDGSLYRVDDMAELAARLGSPIRHDRRGEVIWYNTFDYGLSGIHSSIVGSGSEITLEERFVETPPFAIELNTGSLIAASAFIYYELPIPTNLNLGLQSSIRASTNTERIYFDLWIYDGTNLNFARVIIDVDTGQIFYIDTDNNEVELSDTLPDLIGAGYYTHCKLVADFSSNNYVRFVFDGTEYDLSGTPLRQSANSAARRLYVKITLYNKTAVEAITYVDNMIVTTNEQ